jgi:hypothetical protein
VTFTENGNGTATLRGLWDGSFPPSPPCTSFIDTSGNVQNNCPPTIVADNEAQRVGQKLTFSFLSKAAPPPARFLGPNELKFVAGLEARYLLTTSGAQTPVEWRTILGTRLRDEFAQSLPWLRFDEQPDGTAIVRGVPPMNGQSTSVAVNACPFAVGAVTNCGVLGQTNLKITVDGTAQFMSDLVGTATVGKGTDIQIFVNRLNGTIGFSPYHILLGSFPKGLRIEQAPPVRNGMVAARIVGSPEPGQAGHYEFTLQWTNQLSSIYTTYQLDVLEGARIGGPPVFVFFEGSKPAGEIATQGYPMNSAGVDCGEGKDCADMKIRMQWGVRRIEGLTVNDRTPQGAGTGIGRFGGVIPANSAGIYEATIFAANGKFAPEARRLIKIVVLPTADLNGDGKVDCGDLTAIKNAFGTVQPGPGRGFDLTGDMLVDDTDIDAMVRAVPNLFSCQI